MANYIKFVSTEDGNERVMWINKDAVIRVDKMPHNERTLIRLLDGVQDCVDESPEDVVAKLSQTNASKSGVSGQSMGKLSYALFSSAGDVCRYINKHGVELKSVAVQVTTDHHGFQEIGYIAFYEEKKNETTTL